MLRLIWFFATGCCVIVLCTINSWNIYLLQWYILLNTKGCIVFFNLFCGEKKFSLCVFCFQEVELYFSFKESYVDKISWVLLSRKNGVRKFWSNALHTFKAVFLTDNTFHQVVAVKCWQYMSFPRFIANNVCCAWFLCRFLQMQTHGIKFLFIFSLSYLYT